MFKLNENLIKTIKTLITKKELAFANGGYNFDEDFDPYGCTECSYSCTNTCEIGGVSCYTK